MGSNAAQGLCAMVVIICWARSCSSCPFSLQDALPTASGYLPINESSGSKMFFAYYEATDYTSRPEQKTFGEEDDGAPILLWLQGGPGCSGMVGNFYELGPWLVGEDQCLHPSPAPWNRIFGLLFLDNPVGAGFSIAPNLEDIPTDQDGIARDVYKALQGFFLRFPDLRSRPFFVTGESYAGKYVPAVATYILGKQGDRGPSSFGRRSMLEQIRLDGVAIGNGLTHPVVQIAVHAPTAFYMGLIDENQKEEVDEMAARAIALIEEESWKDAHDARVELLAFIQNLTGLATLLDVRRTTGYYVATDGTDYLTSYMNKAELQRHLLNAEPRTWEACSGNVSARMASNVTKSTMRMVESLLNQSVPVLLYQGQFDLQDGVASNEAWMRMLQWDGMKGFYASERKVWMENNVTVGFRRSYSSLTHVVVSNSGHFVPTDQAYASQRMIETWVSSLGFDLMY